MGHEWMQQSGYCREHKIHHRQGGSLLCFVFAEDFGLGRFHEPVAVIAPYKVVEALRDSVELISAISSLDRVDRFVQACEQFQGVDRYAPVVDFWSDIAWSMHLPEARHVPKFCREVPTFFDLLFVEANILSSRGDAHQAEAQAVSAILIDQFERIGRVAQGLRHLPAELVANEARKINVAKRNIVLNAV